MIKENARFPPRHSYGMHTAPGLAAKGFKLTIGQSLELIATYSE
jgi:hypothetical protein